MCAAGLAAGAAVLTLTLPQAITRQAGLHAGQRVFKGRAY